VPADLTTLERVALLLCAPVALGVGLGWMQVDVGSWRHAALAAAAAAVMLALAAGLLGLRARKQGTLPLAYFVTCGVLVIAALTAGLGDAYAAGMAKGAAYEHDSAYALAAREFTEAGAPVSDRLRVESEWAQAAFGNNDYADAATHLRTAIALGPHTADAASDNSLLVQVVSQWNARLVGAQRYQDAVHVVADQLAFSGCDARCKTNLQAAGATDYLQWIEYLSGRKQADQALAEVTALSTAYPGSAASKSAQQALSLQSQGLAGAWSAAKAGDATAMSLITELVAARTTDPLQLALAAEASQTVTGTLASTYLYKGDVHLYFIAFSSSSKADAFATSISDRDYTDSSLFKVAAVCDADGNFTVQLPGGYTYLPLWEGPAQHDVDSYFYYAGDSFTVRPYTPLALPYPVTV
jgi:hypothetical protein